VDQVRQYVLASARVEQLRSILDDFGLKKSGTKEEQAARILERLVGTRFEGTYLDPFLWKVTRGGHKHYFVLHWTGSLNLPSDAVGDHAFPDQLAETPQELFFLGQGRISICTARVCKWIKFDKFTGKVTSDTWPDFVWVDILTQPRRLLIVRADSKRRYYEREKYAFDATKAAKKAIRSAIENLGISTPDHDWESVLLSVWTYLQDPSNDFGILRSQNVKDLSGGTAEVNTTSQNPSLCDTNIFQRIKDSVVPTRIQFITRDSKIGLTVALSNRYLDVSSGGTNCTEEQIDHVLRRLSTEFDSPDSGQEAV